MDKGANELEEDDSNRLSVRCLSRQTDTHTHIYIHIDIYTYAYTYIYTRTHAHTYCSKRDYFAKAALYLILVGA